MAGTTYNITLTANHQSLTAKYLPLAAESVQYLTAKVVCETEDWTGREIKAMFGQGCTVHEVPVTGGEITAKQQLNLTAGDWRVWLVGNSARDGDVIPRITTNVAHIIVAPTGGTEGSPFPAIPPTVEEQLRADMGNLADLTTEDKSSLVAAINEVRQTGGGGVQPDWNQNDETQPDYVKNRPFYTGDPVETVLLEETTATFAAEQDGLYGATISADFSLEIGTTYKVSWDGTVYSCVCYEHFRLPTIGNQYIFTSTSDTGEPFIAGVNSNNRTLMIYTQDTSASHTISISATVVPVVKIDPKYIRDMYYTGDPVETVLVEESTVSFSFSENEGVYMGKLASTFSATVGETYKVYWDGAAYECTCVKFNGNTVIGNLSIAGAGSDTGEPFIMVISNRRGIRIGTADTSASHTISISGLVSEVVKIDPKYLPNTVATKSEVEVARTTADNAQATANNAQATANNAQATANTAKTTAENAQTTATNAQTAVNAKFQLMQQNTVTTTTTIGTVQNSVGSVPVKGLNIAVGSTIKFTANGNISGKTVWDRPMKEIHMNNDDGVTTCLLQLALSHDGETYNFTNKTNASILSNLVIEYEKVIIPKVIYPARNEGAWLPPYLIANCLYLTKKSTSSSSATLYRITIDDSGTLKATEVS